MRKVGGDGAVDGNAGEVRHRHALEVLDTAAGRLDHLVDRDGSAELAWRIAIGQHEHRRCVAAHPTREVVDAEQTLQVGGTRLVVLHCLDKAHLIVQELLGAATKVNEAPTIAPSAERLGDNQVCGVALELVERSCDVGGHSTSFDVDDRKPGDLAVAGFARLHEGGEGAGGGAGSIAELDHRSNDSLRRSSRHDHREDDAHHCDGDDEHQYARRCRVDLVGQCVEGRGTVLIETVSDNHSVICCAGQRPHRHEHETAEQQRRQQRDRGEAGQQRAVDRREKASILLRRWRLVGVGVVLRHWLLDPSRPGSESARHRSWLLR